NKDEAETGLTAIRREQGDDGGWNVSQALSSIEATSWSLIALLTGLSAQTDPRTPRIQSGIDYLCRLYQPQMGWPPRPGEAVQMWATYYAGLALLGYLDAIREWEKAPGGVLPSRKRKKVFIVHGHNDALRNDAKEIVIKAGLEPLV